MPGNLAELQKFILCDPLEAADVIVWLHGDRFDRGPKVLQLYRLGLAKYIIISGNCLFVGKIKPGENNISLKDSKEWLKKKGVLDKNIKIDGKAFNTRDQAVNVIKLAKKRKWRKIIVVGSSYYQARAFLTFLKAAKELSWQGRIINQFAVIPPSRRPAGRLLEARQMQSIEAEKIKSYRDHVATPTQGIAYLKALSRLRSNKNL